MHHGSHHLAKRRQAGRTSAFDHLMLVVGVGAAFMTLPQVISIFQNGPAGISLASWIAYTIHSCLWVAYGLIHGERTIVWANGIWVVMNGLVVAGIVALR